MKVFIYALIDPNTKLIRYIGQTTQGTSRIRPHQLGKDLCTRDWVRLLDKEVEWTILEECNKEDLNEREAWWIRYFSLLAPLENKKHTGRTLSYSTHTDHREYMVRKLLALAEKKEN